MSVSLTVSKTIAGADASDSLSGGTVGLDLGVSSTETQPVTTLYVRHDGAEKITELGYFVQSFSGTYGGDYAASTDLNKVLSHGDLGKGLVFEENARAGNGDPQPAAFAAVGTLFRVKTGQGVSYATRRIVPTSAFVLNNGGSDAVPSAPVAGELGPAGSSTLGDRVKLRCRYEVPTAETLGGKRQCDLVFSFAYST